MTPIKFGTDGWRAIIAQEYTVENVIRVAYASAMWVKKNYPQPKVLIGYDCRFGGQLFAETTAKVMCANGVKVFLAEGFVSTPMVSMGTKHFGAGLGVVITASHNPPSYNGFKLKSESGGPSSPVVIAEVESMIPDSVEVSMVALSTYEAGGLLEYVDLETMYVDLVRKNFDLDGINNSNIIVAYDAMYGAGQNVIPQVL